MDRTSDGIFEWECCPRIPVGSVPLLLCGIVLCPLSIFAVNIPFMSQHENISHSFSLLEKLNE